MQLATVYKSSIRLVVGFGFALGLAALPPRSAHGQSFTPIVPPNCNTSEYTEFQYMFKVGGGSGVFELPKDPNCVSSSSNPCPHYINNINYYRGFAGKSTYDAFDLRLDSFQSETWYDRLYYRTHLASPPYFDGSPSGFPIWFRVTATNGSLDGEFRFVTDGSITFGGFEIKAGRVCTFQQSPYNTLINGLGTVRKSGMLLGTNDVVEFSYTFPTDGDHTAITVSGEPGFATDVDLYARCGARPTPTQFDWRGFSSNAQEYFDVTSCSGTVYIAVHSFSGSGPFHIVKLHHRPVAHRSVTVNKNWSGDPDNRAQWSIALRDAARFLFGATEGNVIIDNFDLYNGPNCNDCGGSACNFCFKNLCCGASCPTGGCGGQCEALNDVWFSPRTIAHELAHQWWCVDDEYTCGRCLSNCGLACADPSCSEGCGSGSQCCFSCGHSIMALETLDDQNNMCNDFNHGKDPKPPGTPLWQPDSAHKQAWNGSLNSSYVNSTNENYSFIDFDFNGLVGAVTLK